MSFFLACQSFFFFFFASTTLYCIFCFQTLVLHYFSLLHRVHLERNAEQLERMKQTCSGSWRSSDVQGGEMEVLESMWWQLICNEYHDHRVWTCSKPSFSKMHNFVIFSRLKGQKGNCWFHYWVDAVHLTILSFAVHVLVMVKGSLFIFPVGIFLCCYCISSLTSLFKTSHRIIFPPSYWQSVMLCSCRNLLFVFLSFIFPLFFLIRMGLVLFFFYFLYFVYIIFNFCYNVLLFPVLWQHAVIKTPVVF